MGRQLPELLTDFVDTRKQRRLIISLACGTSATILAFAPASQVLQNALATLALIGWIFLIREGAQTRNQYQKVERGLLPLDTWLDPPANVFQAGDVIGTTGAWWEPHHQAFAHCELISATTESGIIANKAMSKNEWTSYLEARQGELLCASSCSMEYGTYVHSCEDVVKNCLKQKHLKEGHERWFCARLTEAGRRDLKAVWGEQWEEKLNELVLEKLHKNKFARRVETLRRQNLVNEIPLLSTSQKRYLKALLRAKGYNWCKMLFAETEEFILFLRGVSPELAWILFGFTNSDESDLCSTHVMSILLDDLKLEAKVKRNIRQNYTPFGFGNPVLPVEVLLLKDAHGEPYYRLLTNSDKLEYETQKLSSIMRSSLLLLALKQQRKVAI